MRNVMIPYKTVTENYTKIFLLCNNLQYGINNTNVREFRRFFMA